MTIILMIIIMIKITIIIIMIKIVDEAVAWPLLRQIITGPCCLSSRNKGGKIMIIHDNDLDDRDNENHHNHHENNDSDDHENACRVFNCSCTQMTRMSIRASRESEFVFCFRFHIFYIMSIEQLCMYGVLRPTPIM